MTRPIIRYFDENDVQIDREMNDAEYAQYLTDQSVIASLEATDQARADAKASGITHALSLGFTQAQAEAMFP